MSVGTRDGQDGLARQVSVDTQVSRVQAHLDTQVGLVHLGSAEIAV